MIHIARGDAKNKKMLQTIMGDVPTTRDTVLGTIPKMGKTTTPVATQKGVFETKLVVVGKANKRVGRPRERRTGTSLRQTRRLKDDVLESAFNHLAVKYGQHLYSFFPAANRGRNLAAKCRSRPFVFCPRLF